MTLATDEEMSHISRGLHLFFRYFSRFSSQLTKKYFFEFFFFLQIVKALDERSPHLQSTCISEVMIHEEKADLIHTFWQDLAKSCGPNPQDFTRGPHLANILQDLASCKILQDIDQYYQYKTLSSLQYTLDFEQNACKSNDLIRDMLQFREKFSWAGLIS